MKLSINKIKLVWNFIFGGGTSGIVKYLLTSLKNAFASLPDTTKEKIQAVLNFTKKILSVLSAIRIFIPTKWQTAYDKTLDAINEIVDSLADLEITKEELDGIIQKIGDAIKYWTDDDDETCKDSI